MDGHACKPYFGKFPYGVVESFSKATLVLDSWYNVLGKVFKSYNARMSYQSNCFSSLQAGICIPPRLVDYNFAISVP
jgi:hypothetical protein